MASHVKPREQQDVSAPLAAYLPVLDNVAECLYLKERLCTCTICCKSDVCISYGQFIWQLAQTIFEQELLPNSRILVRVSL